MRGSPYVKTCCLCTGIADHTLYSARPKMHSIVQSSLGGSMRPLNEPNGITLDLWLRTLTKAQLTIMLVKAAQEHPTLKLSDPETVGKSWLSSLMSGGIHRLPKYQRDYLAKQYLKEHDTIPV